MMQHYPYMEIHMKPINNACKQIWIVKVLPRNAQRKRLQNLAGIYTHEIIPLIQASSYHGCYKILCKVLEAMPIHHNLLLQLLMLLQFDDL